MYPRQLWLKLYFPARSSPQSWHENNTAMYCNFSYGTDNKRGILLRWMLQYLYMQRSHTYISFFLYIYILHASISPDSHFFRRISGCPVSPRMVSFNSGLGASMALVAYYPRLCGMLGFPLLLLLVAPWTLEFDDDFHAFSHGFFLGKETMED